MFEKQNVLFIITDQQQKQTLDADSICMTPNIENLKKDSINFDKAYTCNAICSPSRASLMTGLLPHNHGMVDCTHNVPEYRANFCENSDMLSRKLKRNGYRLGYYGKWHIERSNQLENFGFDDYETEVHLPSFSRTMIESYQIEHHGYNDCILSGVCKERIDETEEYYIFSKGIEFIQNQVDNNPNQPWSLFLSTYAPHDPYIVPEELYEMYDIENINLPDNFEDDLKDKPSIYKRLQTLWKDLELDDYRKVIACYYAYCTLVDTQLKRVIDILKQTGQYDNTLIVYLSDHGDMMGAHGLFCKGVTPFEEVYNIPLIIKWPNSNLRGYNCSTYVSMHDIAPTILDMLGYDSLENTDGESIVPYINGLKKDNDKVAYAEFHGQRMFYTQRIIWKNNFKYIFNGFDYDEFYDLNNDPFELNNVINEVGYQIKVEELAREMWEVVKRSGDFNLLDTDYYMFRFAPIGPEAKLRESLYNK